MSARRLFSSFSGGETSAMMTRLLLTKWRDRYDEVLVVFANTGEERQETLEFVQQCDRAFGFNVVWVEADVHPKKRDGTTHRVVSYETASRHGEPYEDVIRKYGIPNAKWLHCTRELKTAPMHHYVQTIWEPGSYDTAIGFRAEEEKRRSKTAKQNRIVYPLMDWTLITKHEVNQFWAAQPFRLNLINYQGNCKWCFKKSDRKLLTIMKETPEAFDFPRRMEEKYGLVGAEFAKTVEPGYHRVFFRHNKSTQDLSNMLERMEEDDPQMDLDDGGCSEHCEAEPA